MEKMTFIYGISLFIMMTIGVLALSYTGRQEDLSHYEEVVVGQGESIWSIAEKYEEQIELNRIEFVQWVEEKNNLKSLVIKPGDKVIIPVQKKIVYNKHLLATE